MGNINLCFIKTVNKVHKGRLICCKGGDIVTRHYINLTNGIEAIPNISDDFHYLRIQSTICEQNYGTS